MDKDKKNSSFDFDNDPEFNSNFYKNIEKVLKDSEVTAAKEDNADTTPSDGNAVQAAVNSTSQLKEESAAASTAEEIPDHDIDDELIFINSSLAQQISDELDHVEATAGKKKKNRYLSLQNGIILTVLCLMGFGFFFGFTKPGNHILMDMGINLGGLIWAASTNDYKNNTDVTGDIDYIDDEDTQSSGKEIDPSTIAWPNNSGEGRQEKGVFNILLLGEEAIGQGSGRGRTDEIIIATLNTNDNTIKMASLMRDQLVQIPGYKDNKLNVAYEEGGIDLLYQTIAMNFDIHIDGSVMVNFKNFEKIVNELGGLEITLTAAEAKYLNTTNYISNPDYRHVVEGTQLMNGNQVLGYSRVRHRAAITGNNNDYGRTDRHRIVLNAIFNKCKSMDKAELASLMLKFLPMITTDIDKKNFQSLLDAYLKTGAKDIQQLRIPADGTFQDNVKVRGMSVLIPNYAENIEILQNFIFSDQTADNTGTSVDKNTESGVAENTTDNSGN